MTKLSRKKLDPEQMSYLINNVWSAFTFMDSKEKIRALFKDLVTHTELKMFAKRLEVARRLLEGHLYNQIENDLKVTSATIATVSNHLFEKGEGFREAHRQLSRIEEKYKEKRKKQGNLHNPYGSKLHRKNLLGVALAVGIKTADKKLSRYFKHRTARKKLDL